MNKNGKNCARSGRLQHKLQHRCSLMFTGFQKPISSGYVPREKKTYEERLCPSILSPVQTDATLLDVTCCVRLHTLLHVVGSCCAKFVTGETFNPLQANATTTNTQLANNVGSCCVRLHIASIAGNVEILNLAS